MRRTILVDARVLLDMFFVIDDNFHVYALGVTVVRSPDILGKTMRDLFIARGIAITPK